MRSLALATCLTGLLLLTSAGRDAELLGEQAELFESALAQGGLTLTDVRFDLHDRAFFGGDRYRLPFFDALVDNPGKISSYTRGLSDSLLASADKPSTVLVAAQARINQSVRLGLVGDPLEPYLQRIEELGQAALRTALLEAGEVRRVDYEPLIDETAPRAVLDSAALYLFVLPRVELHLREAFAGVPLSELEQHRVAWREMSKMRGMGMELWPELHLEHDRNVELMLDSVDFGQLNTGSTLLSLTLDHMAERLEAAAVAGELEAMPPVAAMVYTRFGRVEVRGNSDDTYEASDHWALVIDTGGDDSYLTSVASGADGRISAVLDVRGNDLYAPPAPKLKHAGGDCAGGVMGYGMLYDLAGDDTCVAENGAWGFGMFGVGLHYDGGGNDRYSAVSHSQGCGVHGTGVLINRNGDDVYDCYQCSQGYGYTLGVGLLLDVAGDDTYRANDTDIRYPSPQSAEHNVSMAQGVGNGRRGDYLDGRSWAGGVGMLVDGAGDDSYSCGVFGQGCSYWYGVGILADKSGADTYSGVWYVQGAGAHFGVAILQDDAGDDSYLATMNMAQGAGHDFNLGWLEDSAGNDSYRAPNLSLGAANANGIGVLWDKGGDDVYVSRGVTLGAAGGISSPSLRTHMLNVGIFIDGGGTDGYWEDRGADAEMQPWDFAGDGKVWRRDPQSNPPGSREYGVGLDR